MLWIGDELVSHVALIRRTVVAAGQPVDVAGVGYVGTRREHRARGLASQTMRRAQSHMPALAVDFGLLVTGQRTAPFYQRLGWSIVPGPATFDQPSGQMTWPGVLMAWPVRQRDWPGGPVDLGGLLW
jgi:predicted N-acetyltransferase YhbS